jgi:branched-chain amino acid transport system substrate-binding protein
MKRGMEIAVADYGGELQGHPIELTGFDSECNELAAQRGAQILVRDESVAAILGTSCSRGAIRAAPIVSDGDRVLISASSTSPELTDPESRAPGFFRTAPSDYYQVLAAAKFAYDDLGLRTLATISIGGEKIMQLQSKALCEAFTELGGECVLERTMEADSTYMPPVINNLVEFQPDAVYFMGWGIEEAAAFVKAAKADPVLKDSAIFLWFGYNNPGFLELAGDDAVGVYISVTTFDFEHTDAYDAFLEAYREKYSEEPQSEFHGYIYDAAVLLLKAMNMAAVVGEDGSLVIDPFAVREALYNLPEFVGLTGVIKCSLLGECNTSAEGKIYEFISGDPTTFNPGPATSLSSNPSQVWP